MSTLALGLRNNNPLNIRYNAANKWQGQVGKERGFCKFENRVWGYRAAMKIMKGYHKYGRWTVREMIERWAPPEDHNYTERYIMYVCNHARVSDVQKLRFDGTAEDRAVVVRVVEGMAIVENGVKWKDLIKREEIEKAYGMV